MRLIENSHGIANMSFQYRCVSVLDVIIPKATGVASDLE